AGGTPFPPRRAASSFSPPPPRPPPPRGVPSAAARTAPTCGGGRGGTRAPASPPRPRTAPGRPPRTWSPPTSAATPAHAPPARRGEGCGVAPRLREHLLRTASGRRPDQGVDRGGRAALLRDLLARLPAQLGVLFLDEPLLEPLARRPLVQEPGADARPLRLDV